MRDHALTELQLEVMKILWRRGEATVVDVWKSLNETREYAHSTVATLLRRLEARGLVEHRVEGRQFVYSPTVVEAEIQRSIVDEFAGIADRVFDGDVAGMLSTFLTASEVDPAELDRIRAMIEREQRAREADS